MGFDFKMYRRECFRAIRELLCCKENEVVEYYLNKAKLTTNDRQLSQVMTEVRQIL